MLYSKLKEVYYEVCAVDFSATHTNPFNSSVFRAAIEALIQQAIKRGFRSNDEDCRINIQFLSPKD